MRRTSLDPSTIEGKVEIGVVIPKRRAVSAIVEKPTCAPILALIVLMEREKAYRKVTGPKFVLVEFCGLQPSIVTGSSTMVSVGFMPDSSALK